MKSKKEMIKRANENKDDIIRTQYKDELANIMYDFCEEFGFDVDFTACENTSDSWIEASIYVDNLIGENKGYNVIVDVEVDTFYGNTEEFVDNMRRLEKVGQKIYKHFNP